MMTASCIGANDEFKVPQTINAVNRVAVVIPCYRTRKHIAGVLKRIGREVSLIYVVDDACPENTGAYVTESNDDPRVTVITHQANQGVGGAVLTGYRAALAEGAEVIVKIDGDGQMDPCLIPYFIHPILSGEADYVKGNRFYDLSLVESMPVARLIGNAGLSFLAKISTGYWSVFDPTNGYTAISGRVAQMLPLDKISRRYFFESDMLFRLNILRAVVLDLPMRAAYGEEESGLDIRWAIIEFSINHVRNFGKRIFYNYFLRDFNIASVELILGVLSLMFGIGFGLWRWYEAMITSQVATAGTVMLAALPVITGVQMILAFLYYDIYNQPSRSLSKSLNQKSPFFHA